MRNDKTITIVKVGVATSLLVTPFGNITQAETYSDPAVSWSNASFVPYLNNDGTVIYDPANEPGISPDDVDFSSGYSKGSGDKPSFYVGSDGSHLFFRVRLHGDPYDRKGGFLSSVWLVDIAQNGVHQATVGLNGKSPHEDYIYVSNANGTVVNKIYSTDESGSHVPGSRIVEAENGEYFLDFQVPISRITEVATEVTANSTVQFFFGTSKAANLSVINKDYMGPNTGVNFNNAASVKLNPSISFQIPTIEISSSATFDTGTPTFTGTTTKAANGSEVTLTLNNKSYKTAVVNGTWSVVLPTGEMLPEGTYTVTAKVINEFNNLAMTKQEITVGKIITIDGSSTIRVSSFPNTVSGTFTNITSGSKKVMFTVKNSSGVEVYSASSLQIDSKNKWIKTGISLPSLPEGTYTIEAVEDSRNNADLPRVSKTVIIDNQIQVEIKDPANNTSSLNAKPTITGTADPEAEIELFIDGQFYRKIKADISGNWSIELDKALTYGTHTFRAKATDEIGNTKDSLTVNYTVTSLNLDIANGPRVETNDKLPTIRGRSTASDGSKVIVKVSDTLILETTVTNGKWSVDVEEPLNDQTYNIHATVTSKGHTAQALQELVIDSTTFVSITSPANGSLTENRREPITGKSEPFATLDINVDNGKIVATVFADNNGNWTYTPGEDLSFGQHQVTVTTSDVNGNNAIATAIFSVNTPGNKIPTVPPVYTEETVKNTAVGGVVVGSDEDDDPLTYNKGLGPRNGSVVVSSEGTWIYTPNTGYTGTDTFTVLVSDGKGGTVTTTISIEVKEPINQVPIIAAQDLEKTTLKNTPVSDAVVATDGDGDALTFTKGTDPSNGTVVVNGDGTWTYTPSTDYTGTDGFTIVVSDGKGGTATATVTIQVNEPSNQAPTIGDQDLQTEKNKPVNGKVVATDADGDALTFTKETDPSNGTVVVNGDGTWTYTPNNGYTGTDSFTVTVSDGKGGTATATITIQVNEQPTPNQAPAIGAQDLQKVTLSNTPVNGVVVATDADGDALTFTKGTDPGNGTVVVNGDGSWTYTPNNGYTGTDSFTVTVSDGKGGTATATITIQVNEQPTPNQEPTIGEQDLQKVTLSNTPVNGKIVATDADGDALTFTKGTDPSNGTVVVNRDGTWTYTPSTDYTGTDRFTVVVSDGKGGTVTATVTIQVNEPSNQAPTIGDQDLQTEKNKPVNGKIVATDADGDALTFTKGTEPGNGTVVVNEDGTWTYTPNNGYTGTDSFKVTVSDGKGGKATATITIQVNEPPTPIYSVDIDGGNKRTIVNRTPLITGSAFAIDFSTVTVELIDNNGSIVESAAVSVVSGKWSYQTAKLLNPGTYTVNVRLLDPNGVKEYSDRQELVIDEAEMYIQMSASPASIVGDGKTRAIITAVIKDANGKVIVGEKVTFTAEAGTLSNTEVITNSRGEAIVELISPDLSGTVEVIQKKVKATLSNPDNGLFGEDQIVIQFMPASISGVIVDWDTGKPIPGALIEVREDFNKDGIIDFSVNVLTDSEGKYTVAVPYANWNYKIVITATRKIGNKTYPLEFIQYAKVGQTTGKDESFKSESTVSGQLFMMNKVTDTPEKIDSVLSGVEIKPKVLNDPLGSLNITVDTSGKFQITGGEKGKTYQVVFNLLVKDANRNQQELVGHQVSVFIPEEGTASVQAALIDPFGIVTDDVTGLPISDVKVQLYWADTELNKSKGRRANELVNLPILEGFAPSDNRVPQLTDKTGAYAWMVFPEGDYYIVAEKAGYVTFDSRTEGRDVPKIGEDSYILDGVIHVGYSIVEFNFSMSAIKEPGGNPNPTGNIAPTIGDYQFKVKMDQTLKQKVVGNDPEKALLTYEKHTDPKNGTVIVNLDGSFTYTPSPGFVGSDQFIINVIDDKGAKSSSSITIMVEKKESTTVGDKILVETFVNRTISGNLIDIHVKNPTTIELKTPLNGTVTVDIEHGTWSYTPDQDYVGSDQFIVYYYDNKGVLYTQVVEVMVHSKMGNIDNSPVNPPEENPVDTPSNQQEDSMKELPKTGSILDRNLLLGAAGLLTALGLVLRRTGRRKKEN
ncbi:Ig-like domain-containing protein [Fredinandcohnia humi]